MAAITKQEVQSLCDSDLPLVSILGAQIEEIGDGEALVLLPYKDELVRPGGTVSGPAMMAIADYAFYIAVMSRLGLVSMAVTTNLTCNFLRKPEPKNLEARSRILKLGKRLAFGEVFIYSQGDSEPVAHATCTYSLPVQEDA